MLSENIFSKYSDYLLFAICACVFLCVFRGQLWAAAATNTKSTAASRERTFLLQELQPEA